MKRIAITIGVMWLVSIAMFGQGAKNIKINEVLTKNTSSILDEYGEHRPWVELENTSFSTYNVRGMYIATDTAVLNPTLSAPERIQMMSQLPNEEKRTSLTARQHLLLFLNSNPMKGGTHLTARINPDEKVFVALYDGNGIDLIDSVWVPVLAENASWARLSEGNWSVKEAEEVTPAAANHLSAIESKVSRIKREDPHGFGITLLSMGIVFSCLALLCIFFTLFGIYMRHKQELKNAAEKQPLKSVAKVGEETADLMHKTNVILKDGLATKGIDKEIYIAVISMALKQYQDDVHDVESGIITIQPKRTKWTRV